MIQVKKPFQDIIFEKKPPIAYITLNRPEKLNALSPLLQMETREALEEAGWNDLNIRVIVIKAAGRAFSAGYDISPGRPGSSTPEMDAAEWRTRFQRGGSLAEGGEGRGFGPGGFFDVFWRNPKPIIAQVHGFCLAGGMGIAAFSDLCYCSEDALFGYPRARDSGPFLYALQPWLIGRRKAMELSLTGNLIDAQEAYRLGFVNKVLPNKEKLEEEVNKMARTISKLALVANECSKVAVNNCYDLMNIRSAIERASELEAFCLGSNSLPELAEFKRLTKEQGLKTALDWRYTRFAEEDAWWTGRQKQTK